MKKSTLHLSSHGISGARGLALALLGGAALALLVPSDVWAQAGENSYVVTNLVSDLPGQAAHTDPNLVNPWGLTLGNEFWVSDNGTGVSTLYELDGTPDPLVVTIPPSANNSEGVSAPTGQVFNPGSSFAVQANGKSGPAIFIFVSEDGAISGWNPSVSATQAILAVDHSADDAIYKGSTLNSTNDRLYVTNFHAGRVEMYDANFNEIDTARTFVDPDLPQGYAPFGIQNIDGVIVVTFAKQDANKEDDVPGPGHGFVSLFDENGKFLKRLISRGPLNSPWGVALAPASGFGRAHNQLLIGNFGDGRINVFGRRTGTLRFGLHQLDGSAIAIDGLWGMLFVGSDLYVTAGPDEESHGLFAKITLAPH